MVAYTSSSTSTVWEGWVNVGSTGDTTTVWSSWSVHADATTSATNSSSCEVWGTWVTDSQGSTFTPHNQPRETEEERLEREARQQEQREQRVAEAEKHKLEREEANKRAKELLISMLEEDQARQYEQEGFFMVRAGEKQYKVIKGQTGNVRELDEEGNEIASYCGHPRLYVPDEDAMLTQKLMLETDEEQFLRIANRRQLVYA